MTPQDVWLYFTRPYIVLAAIMMLFMLPIALRKIRIGLKKEWFTCVMCGNCCRFGIIELSPGDVKRIESHGYRSFYDKNGGEILIRKADGKCVFLENGICSIHEFKPDVCGSFPFFDYYGIPFARALDTCAGLKRLQESEKTR